MNNSLVSLLFHGIVFFVISRLFINVLIDRSLGCLWILCLMIWLLDRRITHLFVFSFTGLFFVISRFFINVLIDRSLGRLWILCPMIWLLDRRITHLFVFSFTGLYFL